VEQCCIIPESDKVIGGNKAFPIGEGDIEVPSTEVVEEEQYAQQGWQGEERSD
jgi:hypothetical protein